MCSPSFQGVFYYQILFLQGQETLQKIFSLQSKSHQILNNQFRHLFLNSSWIDQNMEYETPSSWWVALSTVFGVAWLAPIKRARRKHSRVGAEWWEGICIHFHEPGWFNVQEAMLRSMFIPSGSRWLKNVLCHKCTQTTFGKLGGERAIHTVQH